MDGLSTAASVIAVIQISSQVFDFCRAYYLNVKDARNDIQRLRTEITSLQDVLFKVVDLANVHNSTSMHTLDLVSREDGPLEQCQLELTALAAKLSLKDGSKLKLALRAMKWPLTSKEVDRTLAAIGRYKSSFILALTTDQATLTLNIGRDLAEIKHELEAQKSDVDRKAIIHWLSTSDPSANFHASCEKCQPETGTWLLDRPDFKEWRISENSLLWIHGIPGSGKTILSSTVIQYLEKECSNQPKDALAYYYFDFNTTAKQELSVCVSSIISQLCVQLNIVPSHIKQLYERCSYGKLQASVNDLKEMLFCIIEALGHVFIVVDALDECPQNRGRKQLLAVISDMKSRSLNNLHVLITSRREPDIEEALSSLLTVPAIPLQGPQVDLDIKLYISSQLSADPKLRKWSIEVKAKIEHTLIEKANGMFRWVFCQLDALKRCLKASLVYETLEHLPRTLDETYTRLLLAIDPAYQQDAKNALLWLAFSTRPLELTELAEAIVIDPEASPPFDPEGRLIDPQSVFQILSSLITVSSVEDQRDISDAGEVACPVTIVTLAHFSVMEYLISDRIQQGPVKHFAVSKSIADHFIAECCLLYLLQYASSTLRTNSHQDLSSFPLLEYASVFWYQHANLAPLEHQKSLNSLILNLLLSKSNLSTWLRLHNPIAREVEPFQYFKSGRSATTPLLYASDMGLVSCVEGLLSDGFEPNENLGSYETPLHRAVMRGHEDVVIMLLKHRADVHAKDIEGRTPLHCAMQSIAPIVQLLLEHGAEVNTADNERWTPLHRAVLRGHEDVVIMLLKHRADVHAKDIEGRTPLHCAMQSNAPIVQLLLEHGAKVNTADNEGWTPLHLAAYYSHSELARILVDNGAHVEVMIVDTKQTPLHWAAWNEDGPLLDFLLQHGANVNAQNMKGESALHYAARYQQSILPQLLVHDADVDMKTEDGQTPLYWAASNMETEAVQILIEAGSRTDLPLLTSGESGLHSVFHLLLSEGLENPKSAAMTKTALQECARRGYGLCKGCHSLLADWAGHSGSPQTEKEVDSPGYSQRYGVEMVASQALVPDFEWRGTRHYPIWLFPNGDEKEMRQCESLLTQEVGLADRNGGSERS